MKDSQDKIKQEKRKAVREAQDLLVSVKAFIDNVQLIEEYERNQSWLDEVFAHLTQVEWESASEEVSEILYKWGRFLLDNGKYEEGLLRFWEIYEKFSGTRWHAPVFEELVAREQPEDMIFIDPENFHVSEENRETKPEISPYFLDIYPVTNVQYLDFIKATNYPAPNHWENDLYPIGKASHPVVWISFKDALAYAKWRGKRLSTEEEWERAARGPKNFLWPWGNKYESRRCNCRESGIGDTTPIGVYTSGKSTFGCFDMSGNTWEWTSSWYDNNENSKVLKGGSWFTFEDFTNASYRYFDNPNACSGLYGFRCAKSFTKDKN